MRGLPHRMTQSHILWVSRGSLGGSFRAEGWAPHQVAPLAASWNMQLLPPVGSKRFTGAAEC